MSSQILKLCKEAEVLCALTRKWSTKVGFRHFQKIFQNSRKRMQIQKSYLRGVHNGPRGSIDPIWSSRRSRSGSTMEADWCPPGVSRASIGASSVVRVRLRWVRSVQISGPMLLRLKRGEDSRVHGNLKIIFTAFTKIFGICVEIFSSTVWFNQILVALVAVAQSASASECRSIALQYGALAAVCWRQ